MERCHIPLYPLPMVAGANPVPCMTLWNKWLVPTMEVTQKSGSPGTHTLSSFITATPASHLLSPPGTSVQEKPPSPNTAVPTTATFVLVPALVRSGYLCQPFVVERDAYGEAVV